LTMANDHGAMKLFVSDTLIYNNGVGGTFAHLSGGVILTSQNGSAITAVLARVQLENNVNGLLAINLNTGGGKLHVTVRDSTVAGNASDGISAQNPGFAGSPGTGTIVFIDGTTLVNNTGSGVHADGDGTVVLLSDSTLTNNGTSGSLTDGGVNRTNSGRVWSCANNRNTNNVGPEGTATATLSVF